MYADECNVKVTINHININIVNFQYLTLGFSFGSLLPGFDLLFEFVPFIFCLILYLLAKQMLFLRFLDFLLRSQRKTFRNLLIISELNLD